MYNNEYVKSKCTTMPIYKQGCELVGLYVFMQLTDNQWSGDSVLKRK